MTPARTDTRRSDTRRGRPWTNARDLFNTYACLSDPRSVADMDRAFRRMLDKAYASAAAAGTALDLYVDGSWNQAKGSAGIGVAAMTDRSAEPWQAPNAMLGKPVRAKGSFEAELYAVAIGISYALDTFPGIKYVRLRYDCSRTPVCAANLDAYSDRGAPYTNLRSAMARARKNGVTIAFEHVKAHVGDRPNDACDALAKHYAGVPMGKRQRGIAAAATAGRKPETRPTRKEARNGQD